MASSFDYGRVMRIAIDSLDERYRHLRDPMNRSGPSTTANESANVGSFSDTLKEMLSNQSKK